MENCHLRIYFMDNIKKYNRLIHQFFYIWSTFRWSLSTVKQYWTNIYPLKLPSVRSSLYMINVRNYLKWPPIRFSLFLDNVRNSTISNKCRHCLWWTEPFTYRNWFPSYVKTYMISSFSKSLISSFSSFSNRLT